MKPGSQLNATDVRFIDQPLIFFRLRKAVWSSLDRAASASLILRIYASLSHHDFRPRIVSLSLHWGLDIKP
jgi:hypothetical protein